MLPVIKIGNAEITRLIMGGNMISGSSHISREKDDEFEDYYSTENIKKALRRCEECGINTAALRGDKHILRVFREYRQEGGKIQWLAQTASEVSSFAGNIQNIMRYKPVAIYMNGGTTDKLFNAGDFDTLREYFKAMRDTGVPVGAASHRPEFIKTAEDKNLGVDFYMCCLFNVGKPYVESPNVIARPYGGFEYFDEGDPPLMYDSIRSTDKPCFAFKVLGSSHRLKPPGSAKACFEEAFGNIKKTDGIMVGMYQGKEDQIAMNAGLANEILA